MPDWGICATLSWLEWCKNLKTSFLASWAWGLFWDGLGWIWARASVTAWDSFGGGFADHFPIVGAAGTAAANGSRR